MSDAQVANVAESWGKAKAAWGTEGPEFFCSLFEKEKDVFEAFNSYFGAGCTVANVKSTDKMASQANSFGNMVSDWINGYGKPEGQKRLDDFCASHNARGISKDQVGRALTCLAGYMKKFGGDEAAWAAVAQVLLGKMKLNK